MKNYIYGNIEMIREMLQSVLDCSEINPQDKEDLHNAYNKIMLITERAKEDFHKQYVGKKFKVLRNNKVGTITEFRHFGRYEPYFKLVYSDHCGFDNVSPSEITMVF